eukprot:CAMPEP_0185572642 /NCGR_PEP_ID=MMETSP0434-20130131/4543_1 /TAXON_ID=626734 ORGANISM="Favella taraikaensis, Strain Fe Narragansett Bay" /NCGR_SAMPLE_ID=MMETSP0434 /ASSEMBLY_ACC=CAM_ASM_000379 /LENGTH=75 /DNA_ID=CAMNT_0028188601 /DNA_START=66 /DNA_END=293 /DNA_ORIENTATION=+
MPVAALRHKLVADQEDAYANNHAQQVACAAPFLPKAQVEACRDDDAEVAYKVEDCASRLQVQATNDALQRRQVTV